MVFFYFVTIAFNDTNIMTVHQKYLDLTKTKILIHASDRRQTKIFIQCKPFQFETKFTTIKHNLYFLFLKRDMLQPPQLQNTGIYQAKKYKMNKFNF